MLGVALEPLRNPSIKVSERILALWPHEHFVCDFPHGLLSCLWGLNSKSGHVGCLMCRNPYGWLEKLSYTSALLPQPARGVCRGEPGLWKGEDSKPLISVNFVPWLPGSANFEIRQTLQWPYPGTWLTSVCACPSTSLDFGSGFFEGWTLKAKSERLAGVTPSLLG